MKKTMALLSVAGLSMASEFDGADNNLHLYKLQNGITALVHTVDDELRVLPIDYHPGTSGGPHVIYTDDELRVLPIDYHPARPRPSGPIWTDDELRVLPIDYHPSRPTRPNKPIMADDDEFRAIPSDYTHAGIKHGKTKPVPQEIVEHDDELRLIGPGGLPPKKNPTETTKPHLYKLQNGLTAFVHTVDDELRVLPIDYHPPRQTRPNRPIMADDDEFRAIPSDYTHAGIKHGNNKKPVPQETVQHDDELRLIGPGGLPPKKNPTETTKPNLFKLQNGLTAFVHTVDDELRVLPIDYHPPRQTRPNRPIMADDDEFRAIPSDYTHAGIKHGKTKPVPQEIVQNDDELRLIGVGPGSLTHRKNVTETAKPVQAKPSRFTTGSAKLDVNITSNAADDEMRFAHFIPQYRPKKEEEQKEADDELVALTDLLIEGQRERGFLAMPKGR